MPRLIGDQTAAVQIEIADSWIADGVASPRATAALVIGHWLLVRIISFVTIISVCVVIARHGHWRQTHARFDPRKWNQDHSGSRQRFF